MLKNAFVVSLRIIKRDIPSWVIKVAGLTVGIVCVLLGLMYAHYEFSYDEFHPDSDRIFRVIRKIDQGSIASTAFPLVPTLAMDYPEFQFSRFFKDRSKTLFKLGDKAFYEDQMIWADEQFLQLFKMPEFKGDPKTALSEPFSIVLTADMALKYFGNEVKLGDRIDFQWNGQYYPLTITGIIPKWPGNMHIEFDALVSFKTGEEVFPGGITNGWNMNYCYSYVKLPRALDPTEFENQFESFFTKHIKDESKSYKEFLSALQPVRAIHTDTGVISGYTKVIDPIYAWLAIGIGLLILLITAINYMTLTVVQIQNRVKELLVRRAVGARLQQIISQLVLETLGTVSLSLLIGILLVYQLIGMINHSLSTHMEAGILLTPKMLLLLGTIPCVLTIIVGLLPSVLLVKENVSNQRKSRVSSSDFLRKSLLMFQFFIAATLISFTLTLRDQVRYVSSEDPGYHKDQVIYAPFGRKIRYNPEPLKNRLLSHGSIESVSLSFYKPTDNMGLTLPVRVNGGEPVTLHATSIDEDFFKTFGIQVVEGRNFRVSQSDYQGAFILNESAVNLLNLEQPLDAILETEYNTGQPANPREKRRGSVVGIVEDVHFESMHNVIKPMVFLVKPYWYYYINIRLQSKDIETGINHVTESWESLFPNVPFEYEFLDKEFALQYVKEKRMSQGLMVMAWLAIFTTCLGLFSYVRFVTQKKTREVGIRKTLGANWKHISYTVGKDFLPSILIANVIAAPVSYVISTRWLEGFAFHVDLTVWPITFTFVGLVFLAVLTVVKELWKINHLNPTMALKHE